MIETIWSLAVWLTGVVLLAASVIVYLFRSSTRLWHIAPMAVSLSLSLVTLAWGAVKVYDWAVVTFLLSCLIAILGFWHILVRQK